MRIKSLPAALALLLLAPSPAFALLCGTVLDPMSVHATVLAFANYTGASVVNANATVSISCGLLGIDLLPSFTVGISGGVSANPAARYMNLSGQHLLYNIYTTSGYATVWGDGSGGTVTQSFNGVLSLGTINFTGYGQIATGQYLTPGTYSDTITVTVTY